MHSPIMVVDQDVAIRRLISFLLVNEGFEVTLHESCEAARQALDTHHPHLLIIDVVTPDEGLILGRELRQNRKFDRVPLVALTGRDRTVDKYEAYKAGFDGCLSKPFDSLELVYALRAFLRLARQGEDLDAPELGPEGFRLSPAKFKVTLPDHVVTLTRLETAVLAYLMRHPGEVFSAEALAEAVLQGARNQTRSVDAVHAHVRNLRAKIESEPKQPLWVKTMGRRGYFFAG